MTEKDDLILSLFLDLIAEKAVANTQNLEPYTPEMADEDEIGSWSKCRLINAFSDN